MSEFKKNILHELFRISKIISILHFDFPSEYIFPGEKHDFWEFIYVEKGELIISADKSRYLLKSNELAFHKPNEFHDVSVSSLSGASVIVTSFECKSSNMQFFENKILFL